MTVEEAEDFGLFVGCETGLLKGVGFGSSSSSSTVAKTFSGFDRQNEVRCLSWQRPSGQQEQRYLMVGLGSGQVRTFDVAEKSFVTSGNLPVRDSDDQGDTRNAVVGVEALEGGDLVVAAYENGSLHIVRKGEESTNQVVAIFPKECRKEKSLSRMRASPFDQGLVALGGREVDLQVLDISGAGGHTTSFTAKNVKPDKLQLRVPVWVSDLAFVDPKCVAIASRHGQVRLYDVRTQGAPRRPAVDLLGFAPGGQAGPDGEGLVSLAATPDERQVLVGSATGHLAMCDFRRPTGSASSGSGSAGRKSGVCRTYKGCVGSVRWIDCSRTASAFAAVGLDRFLNVFDLAEQRPVCRLYLKSRLNCVLLRDDFRLNPRQQSSLSQEVDGEAKSGVRRKRRTEKDDDDDEDILMPSTRTNLKAEKNKGDDDDDGEAFWSKLKVVRGSSLAKGSKKTKKK